MSIELALLLVLIPLMMGFSTNTPEFYSLITYLWVVGMSIVGGFVSIIQNWRKNRYRKIFILDIIGKLTVSCFCGLMTFFICEFFEVPQLLSILMISIAGDLGKKCISIFEQLFVRILEKLFNVELNDSKDGD